MGHRILKFLAELLLLIASQMLGLIGAFELVNSLITIFKDTSFLVVGLIFLVITSIPMYYLISRVMHNFGLTFTSQSQYYTGLFVIGLLSGIIFLGLLLILSRHFTPPY